MSQRYVIWMIGWLLFCMVSPLGHAQDGEDKPYLPLAVGNEWTYYSVIGGGVEGADTSYSNPYRITESFEIAGQTYYHYPQPIFFGLDTLRTDDEGRVFAWHNGAEILLFDFTLPDSAVYTFPEPRYPADESYEVLVNRKVTVDILGGRFFDSIEFFFDMPRTLDEAQSYAFYPGVGLVRHIGGMGEHTWLFEAKIEEQIVTAVEEKQVPEVVARSTAFPNPFRETTTISFTLEQPGHATLKIYDVLGREVATLVEEFMHTGHQQIAWEGQAQPAGVYIARLKMGGRVWSTLLVRTQ